MRSTERIKAFVFHQRWKISLGLILIITVWAYFPSLYHVARGDQISYLAKISPRDNWPSLAIDSFALNREAIGRFGPGDEQLFRPVLYFFLGTEKFLFSYNFFLWQLIGLALHLLITATLFRFLWQIRPGFAATIWTAFFALMFTNLEAVIWHHINAYLLFAWLILSAIEKLYLFSLEKSRNDRLLMAALFMAIATFTFEAGCLYSLCVFFYVRAITKEQKSKNVGLAFILIPFVYALTSFGHFCLSKKEPIKVFMMNIAGTSFLNLPQKALFVFKWLLGCWFFLDPTDILLNDRLQTTPQAMTWAWPLNDWHSMRYFGLLVLLAISVLIVISRRRKLSTDRNFEKLVLSMIIAYTFVITAGRVNPRGLETALHNTLYYFYNFWLLATIWLYILYCSFDSIVLKQWRKPLALAISSILILSALNQGTAIFKVNQDMANLSHQNRLLIETVEKFIKEHKTEKDLSFYVSRDTPGNYQAGWIKDEKLPEKYYTVTELLYPEYTRRKNPKYFLKEDPSSPSGKTWKFVNSH